jgi:hypothetical protein
MNEAIQVGFPHTAGNFFRKARPPHRRQVIRQAHRAPGEAPWGQLRRVLDCVVNYFGSNEDDDRLPRRLFSYHVIGSPGRRPGEGIAAIVTLAVAPESERCTSCQTYHLVKTGGPEAAVAKAIRYLDAYYQGDHVRKVQSEVRVFRD